MKELEQTGAAFERDILKETLTDTIIDLSSPIIEKIGESIGEQLPGISWFFKGKKIYNAVRDQDMMNKVIAFLTDLESVDLDKRANMIKKMDVDPIYGQRFGAFVLVALDRYDFSEKSRYLVNALKFYERGDISKFTLIRINSAIKDIHLMDIEQWISRKDIYIDHINEVGKQMFFSHGIIETTYNFQPLTRDHKRDHTGKNYKESSIVREKFSSFGRLLFYVFQDEQLSNLDLKMRSFKQFK